MIEKSTKQIAKALSKLFINLIPKPESIITNSIEVKNLLKKLTIPEKENFLKC